MFDAEGFQPTVLIKSKKRKRPAREQDMESREMALNELQI